jgi:hypothetical protein
MFVSYNYKIVSILKVAVQIGTNKLIQLSHPPGNTRRGADQLLDVEHE